MEDLGEASPERLFSSLMNLKISRILTGFFKEKKKGQTDSTELIG